MSLMRLTGGIISGHTGRLSARSVPFFGRAPATATLVGPSDTPTASITTTSRPTRGRRTNASKSSNSTQHALNPGQAETSEPAAQTATAVAAAPARASKSSTRKKQPAATSTDPSPPSPSLPPSPPVSLPSPSAAADSVQNEGSPDDSTAAPSPVTPPPATKRRARSSPSSAATAPEPPQPTGPAGSSAATAAAQVRPNPQPAPAAVHTKPMGVLLVVDGNYLANRSYFGYGRGGLNTSTGIPTAITYGVLKTIQAAIRTYQPSALAVLFDPPGPTFRAAMSLLDPAELSGAAAARMVEAGRLVWQDLATRLLGLQSVKSDLQSAVEAEAAATPSSYLHPSGFFLGPGDIAAAAAEPTVRAPAAVRHAAAARAVLAEALGTELAVALGVLAAPPPELGAGEEAVAAAAAAAAAALPLPSYKAGRTPREDDFRLDFRNLQRMLGLMSVTPLSRPWLEADDLAGLLVRDAVRQGMAVRIVSGDRDLMQLVSDVDDVALLYPGRPGTSRGSRRSPDFPFDELREADVVSALGVAPALVADYKALTGDDSDHLPGVTGIGPKTAAQLLAKYGSLAAIKRAAKELTPKRRAALEADWQAAQYTQALARVLGTPGAPPAPACVFPDDLLQRLELRGFDARLVQPALLELEMRSLARGGGPGGDFWRDFGGRL